MGSRKNSDYGKGGVFCGKIKKIKKLNCKIDISS